MYEIIFKNNDQTFLLFGTSLPVAAAASAWSDVAAVVSLLGLLVGGGLGHSLGEKLVRLELLLKTRLHHLIPTEEAHATLSLLALCSGQVLALHSSLEVGLEEHGEPVPDQLPELGIHVAIHVKVEPHHRVHINDAGGHDVEHAAHFRSQLLLEGVELLLELQLVLSELISVFLQKNLVDLKIYLKM